MRGRGRLRVGAGGGRGGWTTESWWVRPNRVGAEAGPGLKGTENSPVEEEGDALNGKPCKAGRGAGGAGSHRWG